MAYEFSINDFRKVSSGTYNAGNLVTEYKSSKGFVLGIANNHVHFTSRNTTPIDIQESIELKKAFINALQSETKGRLTGAQLDEIRSSLGLLPENSRRISSQNSLAFIENRVRPLMREQVREIIARYVDGTDPAAGVKASRVAKRDAVNAAIFKSSPMKTDAALYRCINAPTPEEFRERAKDLFRCTDGVSCLCKLLVALQRVNCERAPEGIAVKVADADLFDENQPEISLLAMSTDDDEWVSLIFQFGMEANIDVGKITPGDAHLIVSDILNILTDPEFQSQRKELWAQVSRDIREMIDIGSPLKARLPIVASILRGIPGEAGDAWRNLSAKDFYQLPFVSLFEAAGRFMTEGIAVSPADIKREHQALVDNGTAAVVNHLVGVHLGEIPPEAPMPELVDVELKNPEPIQMDQSVPPMIEKSAIMEPPVVPLPEFTADDTEGTVDFASALVKNCRGVDSREIPSRLLALFSGNTDGLLKLLKYPSMALKAAGGDQAEIDRVFLSEASLAEISSCLGKLAGDLKTEDDLAEFLKKLEDSPKLLSEIAHIIKREKSPMMREISASISGDVKVDSPLRDAADLKAADNKFIEKMTSLALPHDFDLKANASASKLGSLSDVMSRVALRLQSEEESSGVEELFSKDNAETLLVLLSKPGAVKSELFTDARFKNLLQSVQSIIEKEVAAVDKIPLPTRDSAGNVIALDIKLLNEGQYQAVVRALERISSGKAAGEVSGDIKALEASLLREIHVKADENLKINLSCITKDLLTEGADAATMLHALASPERLAALLYVKAHPDKAKAALQPVVLSQIMITALLAQYDAIAGMCAGKMTAGIDDLTYGQMTDLVNSLAKNVTAGSAFEKKLLAVRDKMVADASVVSQGFVNKMLGLSDDVKIKSRYDSMTPAQIKSSLAAKDKSLQDLLASPPKNDEPGQAAFTNRVLATYYLRGNPAEQRLSLKRCIEEFEALESSGKTVPKDGLEEQKLYLVGLFKGSGPLLQKMLQGVDKTRYGDYASVFDVVKSSTAEGMTLEEFVPRIQSVFDANPDFSHLSKFNLLGSASVGQTYLCTFKLKGGGEYQVVIKLMRPGVKERGLREAEVFAKAAADIPGMTTFWSAQYDQIMKEFDFSSEVANTKEGAIKYTKVEKRLYSSEIDEKIPVTADMMGLKLVAGEPLDKRFTQLTKVNREAYGVMFKVKENGRFEAVNNVPVLKSADNDINPIDFIQLFRKAAINFRDTASIQMASLAVNFHNVADKWLYESFFGSGFFHNDIHTGNIMTKYIEDKGFNQLAFIDYGNARKLGKPERAASLGMLYGSSLKDEKLFRLGFGNFCDLDTASKAYLADKNNKAKVDAIIDGVLGKGQLVSGAGARLLIILQELTRLGMPLPPTLNHIMNCLSRLQTAVNELNAETLRTAALNERLVAPRPSGNKVPKREMTDIFTRIVDARLKKGALKKTGLLGKSPSTFETETKAIAADIMKPDFMKAVSKLGDAEFKKFVKDALTAAHCGEVKSGQEGYVQEDRFNKLYREFARQLSNAKPGTPEFAAVKAKILENLQEFLLISVDMVSRILERKVVDREYLDKHNYLNTLEDDFAFLASKVLENEYGGSMDKLVSSLGIQGSFSIVSMITKSIFTFNAKDGETGALKVKF